MRLSESSSPIAFLDSGVGGLPYLEALRARAAHENLVYLADTKAFPYGEKSPTEVIGAVREAVDRLEESLHPKMVVVACNTASVTTLSELRAGSSCPIIGVVPAVKPAAKISRHFGVLATEHTVEGAYLDALIADFAPECHVTKVAAPSLVTFVETRLHRASHEELMKILRTPVATLTEARVESVVLGCTHFIHVELPLSTLLGEKVLLIDSREGVVKQIFSTLGTDCGRGSGEGTFYLTAEPKNKRSARFFSERYRLRYGGVL